MKNIPSLEHQQASVNATAGMQDPAAEIQAMRTAIREAHELLISSDDTGDLSEPLAKLKPFLP